VADYQVHPMTSGKGKPGDLREACIREALAIIEVGGVESLSLREVARRLGVSHQAPYKHFPPTNISRIAITSWRKSSGALSSLLPLTWTRAR